MESIQGPVLYLLIACGVVTAAFLGLSLEEPASKAMRYGSDLPRAQPSSTWLVNRQLLVAKINTSVPAAMMTGILAGVLLCPLPESGCITAKAGF